jgi:hypothetical protein
MGGGDAEVQSSLKIVTAKMQQLLCQLQPQSHLSAFF